MRSCRARFRSFCSTPDAFPFGFFPPGRLSRSRYLSLIAQVIGLKCRHAFREGRRSLRRCLYPIRQLCGRRAERTGGRSKHRLESQCILKITEKRLLARMLGNPDCGFCRGCRRCAGLQRFLWLRFCRFRNRLQIIILKNNFHRHEEASALLRRRPPECLVDLRIRDRHPLRGRAGHRPHPHRPSACRAPPYPHHPPQ